LVTPRHEDSLPRTMQALGRRYVRYVNTANGRIGTLWEGRYRAAPIDSEAYFLACCPYIELNPVRAGTVAHSARYPWSSYGAGALAAADRLATDHSLDLELGRSAADRRAYRALFGPPLDAAFLDALRAATNGEWAFGDEGFKRQIATALTRRVAPCPRVGAATPPPTRGRKSTLTPILRQFFMTTVRSVLAATAKTSVRERDPPAHVGAAPLI
jgi:REP-associated tyrosine transposase